MFSSTYDNFSFSAISKSAGQGDTDTIQTLASIIEKLPMKFSAAFVIRISHLPYAQFSPKVFEMLSRQARHDHAGPRVTNGSAIAYQGMRIVILNLFLDALRDVNAQRMTRLCFEAAQRNFLTALKQCSCTSHLMEILGTCMSRIRSGADLIVSMTIIRRIVTVSQEDPYLETRPFLEELLKSHSALTVTVNSYCAYKLMAKKLNVSVARPSGSGGRFPSLQSPVFSSADAKDAASTALSSSDVNKLVTGSNPHHTHDKYLLTFRDFLSFLFEQHRHFHYEFPLPLKLVHRLWQCAVDYSLSDEERDGDFRWLAKECMASRSVRDPYSGRVSMKEMGLDSANSALQQSALNCLLSNFSQLNVSTISLALFNCFKDLFLQGPLSLSLSSIHIPFTHA
jgi:hypothetical protein